MLLERWYYLKKEWKENNVYLIQQKVALADWWLLGLCVGCDKETSLCNNSLYQSHENEGC